MGFFIGVLFSMKGFLKKNANFFCINEKKISYYVNVDPNWLWGCFGILTFFAFLTLKWKILVSLLACYF